MKIGKETIPGLTQKNTAGGLRYYWEPSPAQRRANWKTLNLPDDLAAAVVAARKRNDEIAAWKAGGASPRTVARFVARSTFGAILDRYEREVLATKSAATQRVDKTAIRRLREWAGDQPLGFITRARVKVLRQAMMKHATLHGPGHAVAFHLLTSLRKIIGWYIQEEDLKIDNPAANFGLPSPDPRDELWEHDAQAMFARAAAREPLPGDKAPMPKSWPSIGLAFRIATYIGQRQADILAFDRGRWREITAQQLDGDETLRLRLASDHGPDAGKAMGVYVRQGKTKVWVGVPVEGALRDEIEAAIATSLAAAKAAGRIAEPAIIVNAATGKRWGTSDFIHSFGDVRDRAAAIARHEGNDELADRLETLQFRDLRRTCVVTLGQLGLNDYTIGSITGHSQASIKKILEVYMPRTIAAAARGVIARIGPETAKVTPAKEERA